MKPKSKGRPKGADKDPNDLAQAWLCFFGIYVEIDEIENEVSSDKIPNPEQIAIKRDLFEKLSKEAKEVISVLMESPAEFEKFCICISTGNFKNRNGDYSYYIRRYFRKNWRSRNRTKSVFAELRKFSRQILS